MATPITSAASPAATTLFYSECTTFAGPAFTFRTKVPITGTMLRIYNDATNIFEIDYQGNISVGGRAAVDHLHFDTSPTLPGFAEGTVYWDSTDHTLAIMPDIDGPILQVGQENWVRVTNGSSGGAFLNGECVYINGAQGQRPTILKANATSDIGSKSVLGLVTYDIAATNNTDGFVTTYGLVRNLNTTSAGIAAGETWVVGDRLFLSAAADGRLTKTRPVAPNNTVCVAVVVQVHNNNGVLFVNPNIGWHLNEISNVFADTPANKDTLRYVTASTRWENTAQGAWLDTAQTFTADQTFSGSHITTGPQRIATRAVTSSSGTTVLTTTDHLVQCTGSATHTFTLPAAASGRVLLIKNSSSGTLTVNRAGSDTIDGANSANLTTGQVLRLVAVGTTWLAM